MQVTLTANYFPDQFYASSFFSISSKCFILHPLTLRIQSVFSPSAAKLGTEKIQIRTPFINYFDNQCFRNPYSHTKRMILNTPCLII